MSQALYRKYRSKSLDEIVGQKPIVAALKNALKTNNISHAYLFTGPRGVGKTSIARILAFEINKIPYNHEALPIDIIEIDAASNRGIDEIRDLREKVRTAPTSAKFKIYIIDEVHMLTPQAFNALLKTLEEPPAHVIFILATTEGHKLPETIVSRTEQYHFKLAEPTEVVQHLKAVSKKERIPIDDSALELLASHSGGSLRDSLSLLDQAKNSDKSKISALDIIETLGLPSGELLDNLVGYVATGQPAELLGELKLASENGIGATVIASKLMDKLMLGLTMQNLAIARATSLKLMQDLLKVEASARPNIFIEICLLDALFAEHPNESQNNPVATIAPPELAVLAPASTTKPATQAPKQQPAKIKNTSTNNENAAPATPPQPTVAIATRPASTTNLSQALWEEALEELRKTHYTIYSIVRMCKLDEEKLAEDTICLEFKFPFHQKRMSDMKNQQVIVDTLNSLGIKNYAFVCTVASREPKQAQPKELPVPAVPKTASLASETELVEQIKSVFGGAEVLE